MKIFQIKDISERQIYLNDERWKHITQEHPEVASYIDYFTDVLSLPTKIVTYEYDNKVHYYYKYFKERSAPPKYLLIIVKYLNGEGFIITAYFVKSIR